MNNYLATYKVSAMEYSFGGSKPYEDIKQYEFKAEDESNARKIARIQGEIIRSELLIATVSLE